MENIIAKEGGQWSFNPHEMLTNVKFHAFSKYFNKYFLQSHPAASMT